MSRYVSLNPLDPGIWWDKLFDLGYELCGLVPLKWGVLTLLVKLVKLGPCHHQGRIDLEIVRPEILVVKERSEAFKVDLEV